jgi:hypothetical protein
MADKTTGNQGCPVEIFAVAELAEGEVLFRLGAVMKSILRPVDGFRDLLFRTAEARPDTAEKAQYEYQPRFPSQLFPFSSPSPKKFIYGSPPLVNKSRFGTEPSRSSVVTYMDYGREE